MNPQRLPIELIDVEDEADSIAETYSDALEAGDVRLMRHCFARLIRNHRNIVHILIELCEEVSNLKGEEPCLT
jgi:aspartate oxidase